MLKKITDRLIIRLLCIFNCIWIITGQRTTYLWRCNSQTDVCERSFLPLNLTKHNHDYTSYKTCRLVCGNYASLWPKPGVLSQIVNKNLVKFHPSAVRFNIISSDEEYLKQFKKIKHLFLASIYRECADCSMENENRVVIKIISESFNTDLYYGVDESYVLNIAVKDNEIRISISSLTIYGARHGLETLSQLMVSNRLSPNQPNSEIMLVTVSEAIIIDKPVYLHRGLLIDTGRNYLSVETIKRQIDAMAHSKLNVLHWHATDSQSFPIMFSNIVAMAEYGAYSEDKIYREQDIRDLLRYAKIRGVRIVMEIDAPAHVGNGWQWGPLGDMGKLEVCYGKMPWRSYCIQPPCGQLNPSNKNVYSVLYQIFGNIVNLFPKGEMFHMGGDEVFFPCWNSSIDIINYMKEAGKGLTDNDYLWLWSEFQAKALEEYDNAAGNTDSNIILWSSTLTDPNIINKYLNNNRYIIQTWVGTDSDLPTKLLNLGYRLIMSTKNAWYLDHGFWGSTPYYPWRTVYMNILPDHSGVLGGEVCMWGELVDDSSIDSKVWPRAAAAAERLWSNPDDSAATAEPRFYQHRSRLVDRGIKAEALTPTWCAQNEGQCT